jgi:hypothetical protein
MTDRGAETAAGRGAGLVLVTLASGQFLMTLDSSVMNVAIATVAKDVGTTVTGIQTAITLYTLVMAMLMIPGGKVGSLIGRRRAFSIGCVIYGAGSLTTALAPNLAVLIVGWSVLEGIGAALILPAIVALVAANFGPEGRPRAYGLVMAAGAIAVAVGPLIGGIATTYFSWRYVFVGEVVIVAAILVLARRVQDAAVEARSRLDLIGAVLSAAGLGLAVFGVLRSSEWGWVLPKPRRPGGPGPVADDRGDLRRAARAVAVQRVGAARREAGRRAAGQALDAGEPAAHRRPGDVLLPVPDPGRAVLHHPPLPIRRARAVRDRHRHQDHPAVGHAADRRGRDPAVLPAHLAPARRPGRAAGDVRRDRVAVRQY